MTPEGKVKAAFKALCKRRHWPYAMLTTGGRGASGHPDFTVNAEGFLVLVETKAGRPVPSPLQAMRMQENTDGGALCLVLGSAGVGVFRGSLEPNYEIPCEHLDLALAEVERQIDAHMAVRRSGLRPPLR